MNQLTQGSVGVSQYLLLLLVGLIKVSVPALLCTCWSRFTRGLLPGSFAWRRAQARHGGKFTFPPWHCAAFFTTRQNRISDHKRGNEDIPRVPS
jgi:hypothetical protein